MDDQNKNLILATVLSAAVIFLWYILFPPPEAVEGPTAEIGQDAPSAPNIAPTPPAGENSQAASLTNGALETRENDAPRINIETPSLTGSISLQGGRIDQLSLKNYRETLEDDSALVELLRPVGEQNAYYTLFGWAPTDTLEFSDVPGAETMWTLTQGTELTQDSIVQLQWRNEKGLVFTRTISVDEDYLFTVTQSVENGSDATHRLIPYGTVARHGEPDTVGFFILHEGVVRKSDGELQEIDYDDMPGLDQNARENARADVTDVSENGWIGFTDKYWMTTLAPKPGQSFTSVAKYIPSADIYITEARHSPLTITPGTTATATTMLFAGAKEWETIRNYQRDNGIQKFVDSIDWGWLFFLTKPIFAVLHWLNAIIGNMGWAIIALTLLIKAVLFPLAYKSYASMARMKELQPEMEKIKERVGDDRQKMQQEMMQLYKDKKVNPAAGCLPLLMQIPIFFALYKVIFVTIELRHAPWFGWIKDLSAPDPSSILNLFGLLPWTTPEAGSLFFFLSLGVLPICLGISMWLQQKLNPAPTDATQAMIFAWMPWVFMFMLGGFASGLVVYWIANNLITFAQQYIIMKRHGYTPDIFGNIAASFTRKSKKDST